MFEAALRHDTDCWTMTRAEHAGVGQVGSTPRHEPVAPLLLFVLLTGCRIGEVASLRWADVDLQAHLGKGEVIIRAPVCKTRTERAIWLDASPSVRELLAAMRLRDPKAIYVFGGDRPVGDGRLKAILYRLAKTYRAPSFTWQRLRKTCASYGTNAAGVYGAASVFLSARRLGHSIAVAEKHYLGLVTVPDGARTLEQAMGVEKIAAKVVATAGRPRERERAAG